MTNMLLFILIALLCSHCHCFHLCKVHNRITSKCSNINNNKLLLLQSNDDINNTSNDTNDEEEETIEDLVRRAKQDMDDKKDAENAADIAKKKDVLKKRADKQYEAYWQKQKELSESSSYQQALMNAYYSESVKVRNATATTERLAMLKDNEMLKETNSEPLTNRQVIVGGIGSIGLLTAIVLAKQLTSSPSKGTLLGSPKAKRFFESRIIKRDYSVDELISSLEKSKDSGLSLPPLPFKLDNLKCIRGSRTVLQGNANRIKLLQLFQPTNILSLRASAALKKLQLNSDVDVITIVSNVPNPYEIEMLSNNNSDQYGLGLLMPDEVPDNIFVDEDDSVTRALKLTYPGLVVCLDASSILYALEGQRVMQTGGNAIGAAVGYVSSDRRKGRSIADSWDTNPLLVTPIPDPKRLLQPTRMSVDNGLLYIADTGNNRVLQVSLDGVVKRVFGSVKGMSGKIRDGAVSKDVLLNRPMGLAVDFDRNLYIADTGNDQVIKIKLDDGTAVKVSVADADIDYSGASYDSADLEKIEKTLGKTLKQLRAIPADEVQALIASNNLEDDLLAKRLIGRSRDLYGPTDLAKADAFIYVSASASRQIWRIESGGFIIRPTFGTGLPGQSNVKDPLKYLSDLSFVEPNGLSSSSGRLFVVDSGAGSVRVMNLIEGYSKNILGTGSGSNIFSSNDISLDNSFGDIDGPGTESKMKFGTSCCTLDTDQILVADTLSHKIKIVEVREKGKSKTFLGTGKSGNSIKELSYPQGVTFDKVSGNIFIADTGNNRILIVDKKGNDIKEMKINFDAII